MAGYRDTLNLPRTEFPMKADLTRREVERLEDWRRRGSYQALREARRGRPVWLLHDGPPYSNNHLHMGTAANKVWKDAAVRVHSLVGYDAPFVPGWDNHGMPIEVQVGRDLKVRDAAADRVTLRRACREYAKKWVGIQRDEFEQSRIQGFNHPGEHARLRSRRQVLATAEPDGQLVPAVCRFDHAGGRAAISRRIRAAGLLG